MLPLLTRLAALLLPLLLGTLVLLCAGCSTIGWSIWQDTYVEYRVRQGDTLSGIAERFNVTASELAEINGVSDPRKLPVGLVLQIPFVEGTPTQKRVALSKRGTSKSDGGRSGGADNNESRDRASLRRVNIGKVAHYKGQLLFPVPGARVTSSFGRRWLKFHEGIDIAAPAGSKVLAAHDGSVAYVSESFAGYGKIVVIKGERFLTVYAHNRKNRVSVGSKVQRGEWIADVGKTGDATGSHLHFETRVKDETGSYAAVDPMNFLQVRGGS